LANQTSVLDQTTTNNLNPPKINQMIKWWKLTNCSISASQASMIWKKTRNQSNQATH